MDARVIVDLPDLGHLDEFSPGDSVTVRLSIREGDRERLQSFQGTVIRGKFRSAKRPQPGANFTVRRIASGVGVERILPFYSPLIESVKRTRRGKVRRAKLYYIRTAIGKKTRIKELR